MSELTHLIKDMKLRFTSGNDVPVTRAYIERKEWEIILGALSDRGSDPKNMSNKD